MQCTSGRDTYRSRARPADRVSADASPDNRPRRAFCPPAGGAAASWRLDVAAVFRMARASTAGVLAGLHMTRPVRLGHLACRSGLVRADPDDIPAQHADRCGATPAARHPRPVRSHEAGPADLVTTSGRTGHRRLRVVGTRSIEIEDLGCVGPSCSRCRTSSTARRSAGTASSPNRTRRPRQWR